MGEECVYLVRWEQVEWFCSGRGAMKEGTDGMGSALSGRAQMGVCMSMPLIKSLVNSGYSTLPLVAI